MSIQIVPGQAMHPGHATELFSIRSYSTTNIQNTCRGCGRNQNRDSLRRDCLTDRDLPAWLKQSMKTPGLNDKLNPYQDKAT